GVRKRRQPRLQLEKLESREVLSTVTLGLGDPVSEVMQAAQMSAFFQQSALYSGGQPTGDPTVTWTAARDERPIETTSPMIRAEDLVDKRDLFVRDARTTELAPRDFRSGSGRLPLGWPSRLERQWPAQVFAPYVDMGTWPTFDLAHVAAARQIRFF